MEPLILTARLESETQAYFDKLRQQHFPPERNFIPAHVTLFHALPQANTDAIRLQLIEVTGREHPMEAWVVKLQSLGRGVAFAIDCPRLASIRANLAHLWHHELSAQDCQTTRLHITVQNKATPKAAGALLQELSRDFKPRQLVFEGLDLWQYLGGPWNLIESFSFQK